MITYFKVRTRPKVGVGVVCVVPSVNLTYVLCSVA